MQDPKSRYEASNYVLNRQAPGSGKPFILFHQSAQTAIYAMAAYSFADTEKMKFDKSNNTAATFGDCFTYFAQKLALDEDYVKDIHKRDEALEKELREQGQPQDIFDEPPLFD